jgi:hypothetical protein
MLTRIEVAQAGQSAKAYELTDGVELYLEAILSGVKRCRHLFRPSACRSPYS